MPNWCMNSLEVRGKVEIVDEFKKKASTPFEMKGREVKEVFQVQNFIPMPKELLEHPAPNNDPIIVQDMIKKYGYRDWYEWACNNWGSKWDVCNPIIDKEELLENGSKRLLISYDTAWSPVSRAIFEISKQYPELVFCMEYVEEGMQFLGIEFYKNGNLIEAEEPEWNSELGRKIRENLIGLDEEEEEEEQD